MRLYDASDVVKSQFAVAELPEFKGAVATVGTLPFYPTELSILGKMLYDARKATHKGISNAGYHYMGSAECFVEMSDAFATAMIGMMKKASR